MTVVVFTWVEVRERETLLHWMKMLVDNKSQIEEYLRKQIGWEGGYEIFSEEEIDCPMVLVSDTSRLVMITNVSQI
jgi:hypothetical protein